MENLSLFDEELNIETEFYEYVPEEIYIDDNLIEDDFIQDEEIQTISQEGTTSQENFPDTEETAPSNVSREQINEIVSQALKENGFTQDETKGNTYNIYQIKVQQSEEESISESEIQEEVLQESTTETERSNDDIYNKLDEINTTIISVNDNIVKSSKNNDLILNSILGGVFAIVGGLVVAALFKKINP